MKKKHIILGLTLGLATLSISSCDKPAKTNESTKQEIPKYDTSNPKSIAQNIVIASGGLENLKALKDVTYKYTYDDKGKQAKDISIEKYMFEGELSSGEYSTHGVHVSPELEGTILQKFNGEKASAYHNGTLLEDPKATGSAGFLRRVNYFWLTMMFKMDDPGTIHEYLGQETVNGTKYDKLKVTYDSKSTGKPANDGYILFVNPETKMVDQFLFSLPAMGVNDIVLLMKVQYEKFHSIKLPTVRKMHAPDSTGTYSKEPVLIQVSENLKFNNGFKASEF